MTDLPPLERCPVRKSGAHHLAAIIPEDSDHDMTLFCEACGIVRRMPIHGSVIGGSLDDVDAARIMRAVGSGWTLNE